MKSDVAWVSAEGTDGLLAVAAVEGDTARVFLNADHQLLSAAHQLPYDLPVLSAVATHAIATEAVRGIDEGDNASLLNDLRDVLDGDPPHLRTTRLMTHLTAHKPSSPPTPEEHDRSRVLLLREVGQAVERAVMRLTRYVDLELDERPVTPAMRDQAIRYGAWARLLARAFEDLAAGDRPDTQTLTHIVRLP